MEDWLRKAEALAIAIATLRTSNIQSMVVHQLTDQNNGK